MFDRRSLFGRSLLGRSLGQTSVRSLMGASAGAAGPTARFTGDPYVEGSGDDAIVIHVTHATIGATWAITVSSSGGGADVTDTGTVAAEAFDITLDITGLSPGSLALSYEEDSVEVSTDTALLLPPFDVRVTVSTDRRVTANGDVRIAA